ncbi:MAG: DinB family protein [Spirochaetales bacterium]|nr:DinB family protein [Spirochaetales bacterium]
MINSHRKRWNEQQKILRKALEQYQDYEAALMLCLSQHAMVHSAKLHGSGLWSYEDELMKDMTEETFRKIPKKSKNSIAWHLWHSTRAEDIAINILVAGDPQVMNSSKWREKMEISALDTGNAMTAEEIKTLSLVINIRMLIEYRLAVAYKTRDIIKGLRPEALIKKVDPARIQEIINQEAVVQEAQWVLEYWSKRTIAGLLLMPVTRHQFVHLNQAMSIKNGR